MQQTPGHFCLGVCFCHDTILFRIAQVPVVRCCGDEGRGTRVIAAAGREQAQRCCAGMGGLSHINFLPCGGRQKLNIRFHPRYWSNDQCRNMTFYLLCKNFLNGRRAKTQRQNRGGRFSLRFTPITLKIIAKEVKSQIRHRGSGFKSKDKIRFSGVKENRT